MGDGTENPALVKIAAGAASGATAGAFSYTLFDKLNVAALIQQGTVYGLTVFAIVRWS